jgi:hypothetical protein
MFDVINATEWETVLVVATGRRPKEWLLEPETRRRALFKSVVHHPAEVAAERVASEVGHLLGVPTAETALAVRHATRGIISFRVTAGDEALIDGGDLLLRVDPTFVRARARTHSFQLVSRALPPELLSAFVDLLVLDATIGNSDRHQDNWSIVQAPPALIRIAPSYDHGSSLGRDIREELIEEGFSSDALDKYIANGRSRVGWLTETGATKRLRHIDLLKKIGRAHPELIAASVLRLRGIVRTQTDHIVEELPDEFAGPKRKDLMKELLWRRIALIRANFDAA